MSEITKLRDWLRTNGEIQKDGKMIAYNCKDLEGVIAEIIASSSDALGGVRF